MLWCVGVVLQGWNALVYRDGPAEMKALSGKSEHKVRQRQHTTHYVVAL